MLTNRRILYRIGFLCFTALALMPFAFTCDSGSPDFGSDSGPASADRTSPDDDDADAVLRDGQDRAAAPGIESEILRLRVEDGAIVGENRRQGFTAQFDREGLVIAAPERRAAWSWSYSLTGFGRISDEQAVRSGALDLSPVTPAQPGLGDCDVLLGVGADGACNRSVEYERDGIVEWYANRPDGLEQGFDLSAAPLGDGYLVIEGTIDTELTGRPKEPGGAVVFLDNGLPVLEYHSLLVADLAGQTLPAFLEFREEEARATLRIWIDDRGAIYPLFIDPKISGTPFWQFGSDTADALLGTAVTTASDLNDDKLLDIIVAAPSYTDGQTDEGIVYVFYGTGAGIPVAPDWTAQGNQTSALFGMAIVAPGDANNDGYDDLVIGAPGYAATKAGEGAVFLYLGDSGGLGAAADWSFVSDNANAEFGFSLAAVGDLNDDNYDDLLVGAPGFNGENGAAYIFYGSDAGFSSAPDWSAEPGLSDAQFGFSVAGGGDLNNDGYLDVIVGAPSYSNGQIGEGAVFVYYGSATGPSATADWSYEANVAGASFGGSVALVAGVNDDEYDDLLVGAFGYTDGEADEGRAYAFYGSDAKLPVAPDWTYESDSAGAQFGSAVAEAGDVDKDGYRDVLIGAPGLSNGETNEGRVYVFRGSATGLETSAYWTAEGNQTAAFFGADVAFAGDFFENGVDDIIIGAPGYSDGQAAEGFAFIYEGDCTGGCVISGVCYADGETNPDNSCEYCDPDVSTSAWQVAADGVACDDEVWCNGEDTCTDGACDDHTGSPCPDDGRWCNGAETCNEDDQQCDHQYDENNPRCADDALWCNGEEVCDENFDYCTHEYNDVTTFRCPNDELFCNGEESCDEGNNQCTTTGDACPDNGNWCDGEESCDEVNDQCLHEYDGDNPRCPDDALWCNGEESCDEVNDLCTHGYDPLTNPRCPDNSNWCDGEESCDETGDQCVSEYDNVTTFRCTDDGLWCNGGEFCDEELDACTHDFDDSTNPRCVDNGLWCDGAEVCDEDNDLCGHEYDDDNPRCPDNGLYCDGTEMCNDLSDECGHTAVPECEDDGLFCNGPEVCDEELDACNSSGYDCPDDGLWCNGAEYCDEERNMCWHEYDEIVAWRCPDDDLWCNGFESCDEDNDQCVHEYDDDNPRCPDDTLWCNGEEYCDEDNDVCDHTTSAEERCPDNGLYCDGYEWCDEGTWSCQHEYDDNNPRCPDDTLWCNGDEFCDEDNDLCDHSLTAEERCPDDGLWCNGLELCNDTLDLCSHQYTELIPRCPDDSLYCNGAEYCDEDADQCLSQNEPCPDDGFFCNGDEGCDENNNSCTHSGNPCPDNGQFCDGTESCEEDLRDCVSSGDPCQDWEVCNETLDQCLAACDGCEIFGVCYDDGTLNPDNGCLVCNVAVSTEDWSDNDGAACDDELFCNGSDTCLGGACVTHAGDPCTDDGLWCNGVESCNEDDDECAHEFGTFNPRCEDDSLWCNGEEYCEETIDECLHEYTDGDPRCPDDGLWCTGVESCDEGGDVCAATGNPCPDNQYCLESSDTCEDQCTGCLIGDVCYADLELNPANGCQLCDYDVNPAGWTANVGAACEDEVYCNGVDTCGATGACTEHAGDPCPDNGLWCDGQEYCNEALRLCDAANIPDCSADGIFCNGDEYCDEDIDTCAHTGNPCTDDGLFCTGTEYCDEDLDQCPQTGDPCVDDGVFCNGIESCDEENDTCPSSGDPCTDDGIFCNGEEYCDENNDNCTRTAEPCADDGQWCNGYEMCDEQIDNCTTTGNPCSDDENCDEENDDCVTPDDDDDDATPMDDDDDDATPMDDDDDDTIPTDDDDNDDDDNGGAPLLDDDDNGGSARTGLTEEEGNNCCG